MQYLKGKNSHKLLTKYKSLRKRYWGQHLWSRHCPADKRSAVERGYWVVSSGNVTDEVWKEYIKNQKSPDPDDDFEVI